MQADEALDHLFATARIGHESIANLHRELVAQDLAGAESRTLLAESAKITLSEMPAIAAHARRLESRWQEERLLDPAAASRTYDELRAEVARIEPLLKANLDDLKRVAARLQALLRE